MTIPPRKGTFDLTRPQILYQLEVEVEVPDREYTSAPGDF